MPVCFTLSASLTLRLWRSVRSCTLLLADAVHRRCPSAGIGWKTAIPFVTATGLLIAPGSLAAKISQASADKQRFVLDMAPSGYWPAMDGKGDLVRDHSGHNRHGRIFHVPWTNSALSFDGRFQWIEMPADPAFSSKAFSIGGWLYTTGGDFRRNGLLFMGIGSPRTAWRDKTFGLRIRSGRSVEVISDGKSDAIASQSSKQAVPDKEWTHLLYTYANGVGKLYVNGRLTHSKSGVKYTPRTTPLLIGCDASWWQVHPPGSRSLRGSVREMVYFERALGETDIASLAQKTRPRSAFQRPVLDHKPVSEGKSWQQLVKIVGNEDLPLRKRAESVLALAKMKRRAIKALPVLVKTLHGIVKREGAHLPRVENLLRNALLRAMLDIKSSDPSARRMLRLALARPALNTLDLSSAKFSRVRKLVEDREYLKALSAYRGMQKRPQRERYFSTGDERRDRREGIHDHSYTATAKQGGSLYTLGQGKGFQGVEPVPAEEFKRITTTLATRFPAVKTWRKPDAKNLVRVNITKTDKKGRRRTAYLEGRQFIFDGSDIKLKGWSVAIDKKGYIHIIGGQHNAPDPKNYIPGSWEELGLSRDRNTGDFPAQMYWVSTKPGDISQFEFVGQKSNPRHIPTDYFNYMNFTQDRNGALYVFGRINLAGFQSWGLYRYDANTRRWRAIDGKAADLLADARRALPHWPRTLTRQIRGYLPDKPGDRALVWAWQPHFYNYCRSLWGVRFDRTNRMHVRMVIRGLDHEARLLDHEVYAYSDDQGKTFHRADGSIVKLPLTINPAPAHNADVTHHSGDKWLRLWLSLLRFSGFKQEL